MQSRWWTLAGLRESAAVRVTRSRAASVCGARRWSVGEEGPDPSSCVVDHRLWRPVAAERAALELVTASAAIHQGEAIEHVGALDQRDSPGWERPDGESGEMDRREADVVRLSVVGWDDGAGGHALVR